MAISDQTRHRLHQRLDEVLGSDDAATLMEHLPPVGWADVATKRDLEHLSLELRSDLRSEFRNALGDLERGLRAEIGEVRIGLADLRTELHVELGAIRADLARQVPTLFLGLVGLQVSAAGLAVALSKLL